MKQIFRVLKKRWKWGIGLAAVLAVVLFAIAPWKPESSIHAAGEDYIISFRGNDIIKAPETFVEDKAVMKASEDMFVVSGDKLLSAVWSIGTVQEGTGPIISIKSGANTLGVTIKAEGVGKQVLICTPTIEDADGNPKELTPVQIVVEVGIAIDRGNSINFTDANGKKVWMTPIHQGETESIIMDPGAELPIDDTSGADSKNKMKIISGNAQSQTWDTADHAIAEVQNNNSMIKAVGVGHTILYVDNGGSDAKEIDVFVRPEMEYLGTTITDSGTPLDPFVDGLTPSAEDNSYILVKNMTSSSTSAGLDSRVNWVITQEVNGSWAFVKGYFNGKTYTYDDYKGNSEIDPNPEPNSSADLTKVTRNGNSYYRFEAEAGTYRVNFYPAGVYAGWKEENQNILPNPAATKCEAVGFKTGVDANWDNATETVAVGGTYDLADALNISPKLLADTKEFAIEIDKKSMPSDKIIVRGYGSYEELCKFIASTTYSEGGTAYINVTRTNQDSASITIPGVPDYGDSTVQPNPGTITITVKVAQTFNMNKAEETLYIGSTDPIELYGIWGTNPAPTGVTYKWEWDKDYLDLTGEDQATANITPKGNVKKDSPTVVTLYATTSDGKEYKTTCNIFIYEALEELVFDPSTIELQVGEEKDIHLKGLTGQKRDELVWRTEGKGIISFTELDGKTGVTLKALKTGEEKLMVINRNNQAVGICTVIVSEYMTGIQIVDQKSGNLLSDGSKHNLNTQTETQRLQAKYEPASATSVGNKWVTWVSTDESVATIKPDEANPLYAELTFTKKRGTTTIKVTSTDDPTIYAEYYIEVTEQDVLGITINDKSPIELDVGAEHQLSWTLNPADAPNPMLKFKSTDEKVATIDDKGMIKALSPGKTTISMWTTHNAIESGPASIEVIVKNKLESIEFHNLSDVVEVGKTLELNVEFTPNENVNKDINFTSTDPTVATVDSKGVVTGVREGDVMIICVASELGAPGAISCTIHVIPTIIPPEDFEIEPEKKEIRVGDNFKIISHFIPEETSNKVVSYVPEDPEIVKVDEDGVVTGLKEGVTYIECTSAALGKTKICFVTVTPAAKFSLSPSTRTIVKGRSFTLKKVVSPANINTASTWKSSNTKIATVSSSGKVTAQKVGNCTITCTLTQTGLKAICQVKVVNLKTTLKLNKSSIRINVGQTYKLIKTLKTNDETVPKVNFTSKNKKIATVGKTSGKVKGKKVGSTVVTAKTTDSYHATAKCRVVVIKRATSVVMKKAYAVCYVGGTIKLSATVKPKSATIKGLKWTSADTNIASVTQSGKVTGRSVGDVYITVTTKDGSNKSDNCLVRVMEPIAASTVMVAQQKLTMKKGDTAQLSYTILPSNTTDTVKMASDNKRVATVTNTGKIKAKNTGAATITITTSSGITNTVEVHVVAMNKTSIKIRQYDTENLFVTGTDDTITWYSGNNRIASVANGTVTGRGTGTTYVYAFVDGCKMACKVKVVSVNTKSR